MPIRFVTGPAGKPIPAQRIRTVYVIDAEGNLAKAKRDPAEGAQLYVSHFETCPRAADFSRTRKRP